jgi:2-polyprenyl-3-methyl-5-hydroxy-6-metoxy-1,4-benzoquinol methylase
LEVDWDKRYREGFYAGQYRQHELTERFAPLMPRDKPVIDIAAGQGRDVIFLARRGLHVCGLERSREAIKLARQAAGENGTDITMVAGDAEHLPFRHGTAGTVCVFYFLLREIMDQLVAMLAPGGLLVYETFTKRQNAIDRPRNPRYLLDDGELLSYFRGLELLFYEEGIFDTHDRQRALARYVGRKR